MPKASVFLDFIRDGNRSRFEAVSFGRRAQLAELVLAEAIEGRGRFLDDILNGVWTIREETFWGDRVYRILFIAKKTSLRGNYTIRIESQ